MDVFSYPHLMRYHSELHLPYIWTTPLDRDKLNYSTGPHQIKSYPAFVSICVPEQFFFVEYASLSSALPSASCCRTPTLFVFLLYIFFIELNPDF